MKYYAELLGQTIKKARLAQRLTQAQLAAKANIDVRTIINIEKYRGNPKLEVLFFTNKFTKNRRKRNFQPRNALRKSSGSKIMFFD